MDEYFKKSPHAPPFSKGGVKNCHDMSTHKFVAGPHLGLEDEAQCRPANLSQAEQLDQSGPYIYSGRESSSSMA